MSAPPVNQLIRRMIGAAFDAGAEAARRPAADRQKAREDLVVYGLAVLEGHIANQVAADAARLAAPDPAREGA
jgi:predicted component of type VI protein secretion system